MHQGKRKHPRSTPHETTDHHPKRQRASKSPCGVSTDGLSQRYAEGSGSTQSTRPTSERRGFTEAVQDEPKVYEDLRRLISQLQEPDVVLASNPTLTFAVPPHLHPDPLAPEATAEDIDRICELDSATSSNSVLIGYAEHLMRARREAAYHREKPASERVRGRAVILYHSAENKRAAFRTGIVKEWQRQYALKEEPYLVDSSRHFRNKLATIMPAILIAYLVVASLYLLSNASQKDCRWNLCGFSMAMQLQFLSINDPTSLDNPYQHMLLDVDEIIRHLDLSPRFINFVCCPKCFFIRVFSPEASSISENQRCSNPAGKGACDTELYKTRTVQDPKSKEKVTKHVPRKEFLYQPPTEPISHLYARQDIEPHLRDNPCNRARHSQDICDVWHAPALQNFQFKDGKTFTDCDDEDRLVFSLNFDGLNPGSNKLSGKMVSIGALYLVCLNLPPEIRYKLENVYLAAIIPGPQLPSKHELNYLLSPLVQDFLMLWDSGVYISRTHLRPQGVRVRAAIVPLVCDLPAARHMSGFASYAHNVFCSDCKLQLSNINDLDRKSWPLRTWEEHLEEAKQWRDAKTEGERKRLYAKNGTRWSELLRLPYWDPTRYTLIDSMHAFYLRLLQYHIRTIWGMDIKIKDEDFAYDPSTQEPTEIEARYALFVARRGSEERLKLLKKPLLRYLCQEYGVALSGRESRIEMQKLIRQYRIEQNWWTEDMQHILSPEEGIEPNGILKDGVTTTNDVFWHGSKSRISGLLKEDMLAVFVNHVLPSMTHPLTETEARGLTKEALLRHIRDTRLARQITNPDGTHVAAAATRARNQSVDVLGRDTLKEIRRDMQTLNRPSWQANGPRWPGEARFGKLTAAQWRTFCLVNLPVTLNRIWGNEKKGHWKRQFLDNYMHLVTAIKLATMDRMNEARIQQYEYHIGEYLASLLDVYPNHTMTPYQHLALHFGRHLRDFGPVHAWRCFAFERYNHIMQSFTTNHKFSELEKTIFRKFCAAQRIRAIFAHHGTLPDAVKPLIENFDKAFGSRNQVDISAILADGPDYGPTEREPSSGKPPTSLDPATFAALEQYVTQNEGMAASCPNAVRLQRSIRKFSQVFSTVDHHVNNSHVVFVKEPQSEERHAGVIHEIFSHTRVSNTGQEDSTYFATVSPYKELSPQDVCYDVYRRWPVVAGRLVYNTLEADSYLVPFTNILHHFASQVQDIDGVGEECLLVQPLDKF